MLSKNGIILLPSSWIILATFSPKLSDGNTTGWFLVDLKSWVIISPISWHFPLNSLLYSHELLNFQTETSFSDIYFVWSFGPCFSGGEGIVEYHFFPLKLPYSLALKTLFLNLLPLHLPPDPLIFFLRNISRIFPLLFVPHSCLKVYLSHLCSTVFLRTSHVIHVPGLTLF